MGFKDIKKKVLNCLDTGHILHEERGNINIKNLLSTGKISVEEVINIIGSSRGNSYTSSPHHFDSKVTVHVINTLYSGQKWYIKWYFVDPDSIFISIHH